MSKNVTVKKAADEFIQQLEALGKKASTVGTSKRCLDLFVAHQGEEKLMAKLLSVHVAAFFKSEPANKLNGRDCLGYFAICSMYACQVPVTPISAFEYHTAAHCCFDCY